VSGDGKNDGKNAGNGGSSGDDDGGKGDRLRVNRFFTEHGVCSRRAADRYVDARRVKINGVVAVHGATVGEGDRVTLDDVLIAVPEKRPVVLAYHKPPGIECTSDRRVPDNIIDAVGYPERIFHIGRLDKFSEGLILLTNRGELVNQILRARNNHEKEYVVDVDVPLTEATLHRMRTGIEILGRPTLPCKVDRVAPRTFRMVLTEGRNRQIRRMCEAEGLRVRRLVRVRVMNVELAQLASNRWRLLRVAELAALERLIAESEQRLAAMPAGARGGSAGAGGDGGGGVDDGDDDE
jgi:23S rRNA pseudouridine2604 synthase